MSNTSSSSNRVVVPEAKEAMDKFKMEIADELGVPLTNGYNGNLRSSCGISRTQGASITGPTSGRYSEWMLL